MALLIINDEKKNVGFDTDVIQVEKTPITEISRKINFDDEADQLYCFLKAVCSDELFKSVCKRFEK